MEKRQKNRRRAKTIKKWQKIKEKGPKMEKKNEKIEEKAIKK